ncbi:hypothetical protein L3Q82_017685, partial [Scortum barcoo]
MPHSGRSLLFQRGSNLLIWHHSSYSTNTIVKFADDTTIVGLISDNDETHYREEIQHLTQWMLKQQPCSEHQQDQGGHSGLQEDPGGQSTLLSSSTGKQLSVSTIS